jgi:hypothetical protein
MWQPSNRLSLRKKIIFELEQWTNGGTRQRKLGTSVQPLKKPTANGKKIFESRYSRTKTGNHGFTKTI